MSSSLSLLSKLILFLVSSVVSCSSKRDIRGLSQLPGVFPWQRLCSLPREALPVPAEGWDVSPRHLSPRLSYWTLWTERKGHQPLHEYVSLSVSQTWIRRASVSFVLLVQVKFTDQKNTVLQLCGKFNTDLLWCFCLETWQKEFSHFIVHILKDLWAANRLNWPCFLSNKNQQKNQIKLLGHRWQGDSFLVIYAVEAAFSSAVDNMESYDNKECGLKIHWLKVGDLRLWLSYHWGEIRLNIFLKI